MARNLAIAFVFLVVVTGCGAKKSEAQRAKDSAEKYFADFAKRNNFVQFTTPVSCIRVGSEDVFDCWRQGKVAKTSFHGAMHAAVVCDAAGGPCIASKADS